MGDNRDLFYYTGLNKLSHHLNRFFILISTDDQKDDDRNAAIVNEQAMEWLEDNKSSPFFLYLHYIDPHAPYGPPEFLLDEPKPRFHELDYPDNPKAIYPFFKRKNVDSELNQAYNILYDADVKYCDKYVGQLLDELKRFDLFENSLIIITSDHGEEFYEHFGWGHGFTLYQEALHVPLIMYMESPEFKNKSIDKLAGLIDIFPTICEILEIKSTGNHQGKSLVPLIEDTEANVKEYIYSELINGWFVHSLISKEYKLLQIQDGNLETFQFYNLKDDPGEMNDNYGKNQISGTFLEKLYSFKDKVGRSKHESKDVVIDPRTRQKLEALGYVE